jgi:hypothetical protein
MKKLAIILFLFASICSAQTLRKNVAGQEISFLAINRTDGNVVTGISASFTTSRICDGAVGTIGGTITEATNGLYNVALTQADTNCNHVAYGFRFPTTIVPVAFNLYPVSYDPTDSVRLGLTGLANATAGQSGGLALVGSVMATPTSGVILASNQHTIVDSGTVTTVGTVNSVGDVRMAYLDAAISTRGTGAALDEAGVRAAVGLGSANLDNQFNTIGYGVWHSTAIDKSGYSLTQTFPTNFSALSINTTGAVVASAIPNVTVGGYASGQDPATSVWGAGTRTLSSFGFTPSVTVSNAVTLTTAYDKAMTAAQPADVPAAATVAASTWGYLLANQTASGTASKALASAGGASDPMAVDVVTGGYTGNQAGHIIANMRAVAGGVGSKDVTITVKLSNGTLLSDASVIIRATNDPTAEAVYSGKTDSFGVAQPHPQLNPGTYFVWRSKTNYTLSNPQTIVVP